jgi:hypothetical protein
MALRMVCMALLSISVPMQGLAQDTLETYTARYETSMYGMNLNIERKLVATGQGYRLSSEGKSFAVIDGPKRGEKILDLVGTEELETALGTLETLHYQRRFDESSDRSSDIWVAPSLDYLMVLTRHEEDGSPIELSITAVDFDS